MLDFSFRSLLFQAIIRCIELVLRSFHVRVVKWSSSRDILSIQFSRYWIIWSLHPRIKWVFRVYWSDCIHRICSRAHSHSPFEDFLLHVSLLSRWEFSWTHFILLILSSMHCHKRHLSCSRMRSSEPMMFGRMPKFAVDRSPEFRVDQIFLTESAYLLDFRRKMCQRRREWIELRMSS